MVLPQFFFFSFDEREPQNQVGRRKGVCVCVCGSSGYAHPTHPPAPSGEAKAFGIKSSPLGATLR